MDFESQNILVVINPYSGRGLAKKVYPKFMDFLRKKKIDFFTYQTTGNNDEYSIKSLLEHSTFDTISILGGDGTVNIVMQTIGTTEYKIHIIPCGSGNDLIYTLAPRYSIETYFELLFKGTARPIDLFSANEKKFIIGFGVGFDGAVSEKVFDLKKYRLPGMFVYWLSILTQILSFKESELEVNGVKKECFLLTLANNKQYGGGFNIAPNAVLDDKLLEMICIKKVTIFERISNLLKLKNGKHLGLSVVEYERGDTYTILSDHDVPAHVDGELMKSNNYLIRFDRKVKVIC